MARYNHFSANKYKQIMFKSVRVGGKFRRDFRKSGRRRTDIVCIKTSKSTYMEEKNKKEYKLYCEDIYVVSSYDELVSNPNSEGVEGSKNKNEIERSSVKCSEAALGEAQRIDS